MKAIRSLALPRSGWPRFLIHCVTNQPSVYAGHVEISTLDSSTSSKTGHCLASLRAFSTTTAAALPVVLPPLALPSVSVVAPLTAAMICALDVKGVAAFVMSLGISKIAADKLVREEVDGAALLEMNVEELCRYGVRGGTAHTIMRVVAPAIAEIKGAELAASAERARAELAASTERARAELAASAVTLTVYPPLKKSGANNPTKITLTPQDFRTKYALSDAPLQLVNKDGAVLRIPMTPEEAVALLRQNPTARLRTVRSFGDDLESVNGFIANDAEALEQIATTRLMAQNASLLLKFGPLVAANSAEHFMLSWRDSPDSPRLEMEIDGLVLGPHVGLLNSAKHSPAKADVDKVISDAAKLETVLSSHLVSVATEPKQVWKELSRVNTILPFLSGHNFSAETEAACREKGVSFLRPDGSEFAVVLLTKQSIEHVE